MSAAALTLRALRDDSGAFRTNGPVLFAPDHDNHPVDGFLWNVLSHDMSNPQRFNNFATAVKHLVTYMPKIVAIKTLRDLGRAYGYDMSLWEAKHTCDAVREEAVREYRDRLSKPVTATNIGSTTAALRHLDRMGEL